MWRPDMRFEFRELFIITPRTISLIMGAFLGRFTALVTKKTEASLFSTPEDGIFTVGCNLGPFGEPVLTGGAIAQGHRD